MTRVAIGKVALALGGLLAFLLGATLDWAWLRWAGTGLLAASWMLRFVERGERHPRHQGPSI